jgi:hypothetical protein
MRDDIIIKVQAIALGTKCPTVRRHAVRFLETHGNPVKVNDFDKAARKATLGVPKYR